MAYWMNQDRVTSMRAYRGIYGKRGAARAGETYRRAASRRGTARWPPERFQAGILVCTTGLLQLYENED
ncbi:hypothetical protein CWM47_32110 [Spirosoma pollinicola]|uniref:Uncharacterized protein n=1 Tax=Spirosoma pollinicola TaxID=2057025 RepID=A0A2K8Z884_9BACT|nr:hypothetical protein CWM47_32110 [Spirosoma pollinicola]